MHKHFVVTRNIYSKNNVALEVISSERAKGGGRIVEFSCLDGDSPIHAWFDCVHGIVVEIEHGQVRNLYRGGRTLHERLMEYYSKQCNDLAHPHIENATHTDNPAAKKHRKNVVTVDKAKEGFAQNGFGGGVRLARFIAGGKV